MFSKPLANPSTLDRRAASCASSTRLPSYVEGLWSPSLGLEPKNSRQKHNAYYQRSFRRERASLSLSGGASIQFMILFKLGITFLQR